jgi:hypothetical protein
MKTNAPTKEGEILGRLLARRAEESLAQMLPLGAALDRRCRTCAFRLGTYPNRCWQTVVDAFGCIDINEPFHCHERTEDDGYPQVCAGYLIVAAAKHRRAA